MRSLAACPNDDDLAAILHGGITDLDRKRWERHIDTCADCRVLLAEVIRAGDTDDAPPTERGPVKPRIGRFEIERILGEGAMGIVYLANDTTLRRRVAVKILHPELALEGYDAQRMLREARAMAQLSHPNAITIYEVDSIDEQVFIAMEYIDGVTLRDWVQQQPGWRAIVDVFIDAGRGLQAAHNRGLVHRDFKPDNVLIGANRRVLVTDFGLACNALEEPTFIPGKLAVANNLTSRATGILAGTPAYMAPEQFRGEPVTEKTDQFAFCVSLYEALCGYRPFAGTTLTELRRSILETTPSPPVDDSMVPRALIEIVLRGLHKQPSERFGSMSGLLEAIELEVGRSRPVRRDSPFVGLAPFEESDASIYFGRSRELRHAVDALRSRRTLAIVGPSGVGKSSFVRAGLLPALREAGRRVKFIQLRPGRDPMAHLARALIEAGIAANHAAAVEGLSTNPAALIGSLARAARGPTLVLFVDQLEELYTLGVSPEQRLAFTTALEALTAPSDVDLNLIVSMRSDLLDRIADNRSFLELVSRSLLFMPPADRAALRECLVQPVETSGARFHSPELVEAILDELEGNAGALPLLQFCGELLWAARDRRNRQITWQSYADIGAIHGALANHANAVLAALSPRRRDVARLLLQRLVTPERTKDSLAIDELGELGEDVAMVRDTLDHLVKARLVVVTQSDSDRSQVEIVHESLITAWPTLERWLEEDREDTAFLSELRAAAKQWDSRGRQRGLLWTGDALDDARVFLRRHQRPLPPTENAFIASALDQSRRNTIVRRGLVGAVFAALVLVIVGGAISMATIRAAEKRATREAIEKQREAERAKLAEEKLAHKVDQLQRAEGTLAQSNERLRAQTAEAVAYAQELQAAFDEIAVAKTRVREEATEREKAVRRAKTMGKAVELQKKERDRRAAEVDGKL